MKSSLAHLAGYINTLIHVTIRNSSGELSSYFGLLQGIYNDHIKVQLLTPPFCFESNYFSIVDQDAPIVWITGSGKEFYRNTDYIPVDTTYYTARTSTNSRE